LVGNYLLNWLLETRNKPYTNTLATIELTQTNETSFWRFFR
jgi:hypothetical protein